MAQYEITNEPVPIDFENSQEFIPRTIQNAKNLLMCHMGEIPYDRQRGFNTTLYDLPPDEFEEVLMPELDRVMLWEPDVEVASASYKFTEDGRIIIRCVVEIEDEE